VHSAIPSTLTPRQLTRFSCPVRTPTRSPFRVSQTLQVQSSYPPNRMRPDMENATDVIPHKILSCVKVLSSRSARISKRRQEASSEPVAKASPLGKNLLRMLRISHQLAKGVHTLNSVDIRLMTSEGLGGPSSANIPEFCCSITSTGDENIVVWAKR